MKKKLHQFSRSNFRIIFLVTMFVISLMAIFAATSYARLSEGETAVAESSPVYLPMIADNAQFDPALNCRYGVNNLPGLPSNNWIHALGAGFYLNFTTAPRNANIPDDIEFIPQIRIQQDHNAQGDYLDTYTVVPPLTMAPGGLGAVLQANPGNLWLVGNEPDVANSVQDNTFPDVYARAYHEVYTFIKQVDPTAYAANAALSMMTPGRMQYMDIMWDTYLTEFGEPMPVDVWNMHLYILSEIRPRDGGPGDGKIALGTDPALAKKEYWNVLGTPETECPKDDVYCRAEHDDIDIFIEQINNMRSWMKAHGQQDKPLILSEWSLLYPFVDYDDPINPTQCFLMDELGQCFTEARVTNYMMQTMDYLETAVDPNLGYPQDGNRLVQQWKWYSMVTEPEWSGGSSNLLMQNYEDFANGNPQAFTQPGLAYRDRLFNTPSSLNLVAGNVTTDVQGNSATVSIGFYNSGTTGVKRPFAVTLYSDAALTQVIGTTEVTPSTHGVINGCAWGRNTDQASIVWNIIPVGTHQFWAVIDSNNVVQGETDETDNVVNGSVTIP